MECTLCNQNISTAYFVDKRRSWTYWCCSRCDLVFRDPATYLPEEDEKSRYATHNNTIEDPRYVKFLSPALEGIVKYVKKGERGLDFGCGPGPTLSTMLDRSGYPCEYYDPLFFNTQTLLRSTYDFITCTEVIELSLIHI